MYERGLSLILVHLSCVCVCVFGAVPPLKGKQLGPGQHDVGLLGCPGVRGSIPLLLHRPLSLSSALLSHWLDFGLFLGSLWINKTQTINGPNSL